MKRINVKRVKAFIIQRIVGLACVLLGILSMIIISKWFSGGDVSGSFVIILFGLIMLLSKNLITDDNETEVYKD